VQVIQNTHESDILFCCVCLAAVDVVDTIKPFALKGFKDLRCMIFNNLSGAVFHQSRSALSFVDETKVTTNDTNSKRESSFFCNFFLELSIKWRYRIDTDL
jgi:hypothetical protein